MITTESNIDATNAWDDIDTCCPAHKEINSRKIMRSIKDTLERIPCNVSQDEFLQQYVQKRKAVMLTNCTADWVAQKKWTIQDLLDEKSGSLFWRGDINTLDRKFALFKDNEEFSGKLLKAVMKSNGTIRVFDEKGHKKHTKARKNGRKLRTDKTHLFSDYSQPHPVPVDFYRNAGILTNYQWIILSQKNTGGEN